MSIKKILADTLILGGGWSGLTAADLLSGSGEKTVVLESEAELGGLARTFDFGGFKFDIGGHRLCFAKENNISYVKACLASRKFLVVRKNSKIFFNNSYIDYPINFSSVLRLGRRSLLKIFYESIASGNGFEDGRFETWVKANYGETIFRIFFKEYTEKVWGLDCGELSSVWAGRRIGKKGVHTLIKKLFIDNYLTTEDARYFYYPENGMADMISALYERIWEKCDVFTGCQLGQFTKTDGRLSSLEFSWKGAPVEVEFKRVISTMPVIELSRIIPDISGGSGLDLERAIRYRSLIIGAVIIKGRSLSRWHWCYYPAKELIFSRLHEPKQWSAGMAPFRDRTLLCTEIFCNFRDRLWNAGDADLLGEIRSGLVKIGMVPDPGMVEDICVKRIRYAYPLLYFGYEKPLGIIKERLAALGNIYLVGRSGGHRYYDMEECLDDVRETVARIRREAERGQHCLYSCSG